MVFYGSQSIFDLKRWNLFGIFYFIEWIRVATIPLSYLHCYLTCPIFAFYLSNFILTPPQKNDSAYNMKSNTCSWEDLKLNSLAAGKKNHRKCCQAKHRGSCRATLSLVIIRREHYRGKLRCHQCVWGPGTKNTQRKQRKPALLMFVCIIRLIIGLLLLFNALNWLINTLEVLLILFSAN